jgi:hypothetical protein
MRDIVFYKRKIGYLDIPKVASTSIKAAIYKLEEGKRFCAEEVGVSVHRCLDRKGYRKKKLCSPGTRFIVVRDPVKRFLSAYENRVIHHRQLSESFIRESFPGQYRNIPNFTPSLSQFINQFETYYKIRPIFHHCRPVVDFLEEPDFRDFIRVYKMEELNQLARDLSTWTGQAVSFERRQALGRRFSLKDLSREQLEKLIDFYKMDYELMEGLYSIEDVWMTWKGENS